MKFTRLLLAGLLALGCAPRLEPVEVEFRNLRLDGFERGELELAIFNPNRAAVDVEALRYSLRLGAETVALGERAAPLRVPARDSLQAAFPFSVRFEFDRVFNRLGLLLDDTLELAVAGRYSLPGRIGPKRLPFRYRQSVSLRSEVEKLLKPLRSLLHGE